MRLFIQVANIYGIESKFAEKLNNIIFLQVEMKLNIKEGD